jgi:hypothetical protein
MPIFLKSGLPPPVINAIWIMSDVDKDAMLSSIEFAVAFHLILCLRCRLSPLGRSTHLSEQQKASPPTSRASCSSARPVPTAISSSPR